MPKRFTETDKWRDRWFRALRPEYKLAYLYLLDQCDQAGVIELDPELAEFQIGTAIDWDDFLSDCSDRIADLGDGYWCLCKFIQYQYGDLSENCKAHNPVFASIKKHNLERVFKGYPKGIQRDQDKDKDKEKDKDKDKDKNKDKDSWQIPEHLDCPDIRKLLTDFAAMRRTIGKPIKSLANTSRTLKRFDDVEHLSYAIEFCIANEYQGLKPDYRPAKNGKRTEVDFS